MAVVTKLLVDFGKARRAALFVAERAHHLLIADKLFNERGLAAARFALLAEHGVGTGRDELRNEEAHGREHEDEKGYPHVLGEHENEREDNRDNAGKKLSKAQEQTIGKYIRVGDNARDNVARAVPIQIRKRQMLNAAYRLRTHILHHAIGDAVIDKAHHIPRHARYRGADDDSLEIPPHGGIVHIMLGDNLVDSVPEEDWNIQLQNHGCGGKDDAEHQEPRIARDARKKLFEYGGAVDALCFLFHARSPPFMPSLRSSGN